VSDSKMIDADDELLVAYLDGELPREQRDELENRLIAEESLRLRMQSLQRSWDMLAWLPSSPPNENAVETTLQLVVADLTGTGGVEGFGPSESLAKDWTGTTDGDLESGNPTEAPASHRGVSRKRQPTGSRRFVGWLLPLLVAIVAFGLIRWKQLRALRTEIADFPVAIDMDVYALAAKTDLVDLLVTSSRLQGVMGASATPDLEAIVNTNSDTSLFARERSPAASPSPGGLPDRELLASRLGDLPSSQRVAALSRWDRFHRLDESERTTLRTTATEIRQRDNAAEILESLRQYVRFRELIGDEIAARIEDESGDDRLAAIDEGIEQVISSISRATGRNLSEEAIERLDFTVIQIIKKRLDETAEPSDVDESAKKFLRFIKQRARRSDDPDTAYRAFALYTILRDPKWTRDEGRSLRDGPSVEKFAPLSQRELETLLAMLPPEDSKTLSQFVSDPWMESLVLRDWAAEATRRKIRGMAKPLSMSEKYENLPQAQRELLDLSPPETAIEELGERP